MEPNPVQDQSSPPNRILVVDDNRDTRQHSVDLLIDAGYEVESVNDGAAGLDELQTCEFDLVITDYLMPEMKGDQLVALIKASRPGQRIIMVTAFAEDFLTHGKPTGGVDCVLNKPFSLEELRAAITKVMA